MIFWVLCSFLFIHRRGSRYQKYFCTPLINGIIGFPSLVIEINDCLVAKIWISNLDSKTLKNFVKEHNPNIWIVCLVKIIHLTSTQSNLLKEMV